MSSKKVMNAKIANTGIKFIIANMDIQQVGERNRSLFLGSVGWVIGASQHVLESIRGMNSCPTNGIVN